jgi:hypothetical protein
MARVAYNEPWIVQKVLDAGAYGVICPMLSSEEDRRKFVAACRYPPLVCAASGPRAALRGRDYLATRLRRYSKPSCLRPSQNTSIESPEHRCSPEAPLLLQGCRKAEFTSRALRALVAMEKRAACSERRPMFLLWIRPCTALPKAFCSAKHLNAYPRFTSKSSTIPVSIWRVPRT